MVKEARQSLKSYQFFVTYSIVIVTVAIWTVLMFFGESTRFSQTDWEDVSRNHETLPNRFGQTEHGDAANGDLPLGDRSLHCAYVHARWNLLPVDRNRLVDCRWRVNLFNNP